MGYAVELGRLTVVPNQQGMGLGTRLLKEAEAAFSIIREMLLFTGENSTANIHLYERACTQKPKGHLPGATGLYTLSNLWCSIRADSWETEKMVQAFRDRELLRVQRSGLVKNPRVRALIADAGLPSPVEYISEAFTSQQWEYAEHAVVLLSEKFAGYRFADAVEYGLLPVPLSSQLDTRGLIPADVRAAQHPGLGQDFLDPVLPEGIDLTTPPHAWTVFVSVIGRYGFSAGSYEQVTSAPVEQFTIDGIDTRTGMTRQLWGARLLQAPAGIIPDSDYNETWTFTLFPGEPLANSQAVSGTVLKGRVRFRIGKTNRGIGSARVAPALPIV